jgi:hypothetical protein
MNYKTEYSKIPMTLLLNIGFPTSPAWLNDDQRRLLEWVYDEYHKELHEELKQCRDYIEELEEEMK